MASNFKLVAKNGMMVRDPHTATIQTMSDTTLYRSKGVPPGTASDADFTVSGVTGLDGTTVTSSSPVLSRLGLTPSRTTIVASPAGTDAEWILTSASTYSRPSTACAGLPSRSASTSAPTRTRW